MIEGNEIRLLPPDARIIVGHNVVASPAVFEKIMRLNVPDENESESSALQTALEKGHDFPVPPAEPEHTETKIPEEQRINLVKEPVAMGRSIQPGVNGLVYTRIDGSWKPIRP